MTSWIKKITLLCGVAALFACSKGNGTPTLVDSNGNHPADWLQTHWITVASLKGTTPDGAAAAAAAASLACTECHGKDLSGGIAKVSCFSAQDQSGQQCHPTSLGHPSNWGQAIRHGQLGAMASAGVTSGFAFCAKCHGSDFKGGTGAGAAAVSCYSCHNTAPHPPAPWIGGNVSHATASPTNAAVCVQCHAGGNNFGAVLVSAAASGSPPAPTPDCFNNTLCHGGQVNPPHTTGAVYLGVSQHGIDATGNNGAHPELGLTTCKNCHADPTGRFNLETNNMPNGCETCHSPFMAHPKPWLPARSGAGATPNNPNTTSHATVSASNLGTDCALCHGAALDGVGGTGNAPSCLTGNAIFATSCHATSPVTHTGCTSCHADFVNSQRTTGAHAAHLALPNVSCDACHSGGGADPATKMGASLHATTTNGFSHFSSTAYWGRNGGFRFDAVTTSTCANVRCHGGQTTPSWFSAPGSTINVDTDCAKCHQLGNAGNTPQTPEFNSYYSGLADDQSTNLHLFHNDPNGTFRVAFPNLAGITCRSCHTLTTQQHFGGLALVGFQTTLGNKPGDTIHIPGTYVQDPLTGNYPGTCSNVACHTVVSKNASWGK